MIIELDAVDIIVIQEALGEMQDVDRNQLSSGWTAAIEATQAKLPWPVDGHDEIVKGLNS